MIRTYSMNKPYAQDHIPHYCECGRLATYWSQDEGPNWTRLGPVVHHCQGCRESARQIAGTKNLVEKNQEKENVTQ